jgi:hypothetical protein
MSLLFKPVLLFLSDTRRADCVTRGYNRNVKTTWVLAAILLLGLVACSKNVQTNEAIRQGVIDHLKQNTGLSLDSMDIEIQSVTFRDTEADAVVAFKPKNMPADQGMSMRYTLERKGNEWVVKGKADSGQGHATMPPAAEGMELPPDHPPTSSGRLPGQEK